MNRRAKFSTVGIYHVYPPFSLTVSYHQIEIQEDNKKAKVFRLSPVLALPIFPGRRQPSIVGRNELNYRVRNGNGWTLVLISTNYVIRFTGEQTVLYCFLFALSRRVLVTRTGFEPMLTA